MNLAQTLAAQYTAKAEAAERFAAAHGEGAHALAYRLEAAEFREKAQGSLYQHSVNVHAMADEAWVKELTAQYGRRGAGQARYDERGVATAELQRLFTAKAAAAEAQHDAFQLLLAAQSAMRAARRAQKDHAETRELVDEISTWPID